MLLQRGIRKADTNGDRIYLESSPVAHELYLRQGWYNTDEIVLNLAEFGGQGTHIVYTMIREPRSVNS